MEIALHQSMISMNQQVITTLLLIIILKHSSRVYHLTPAVQPCSPMLTHLIVEDSHLVIQSHKDVQELILEEQS